MKYLKSKLEAIINIDYRWIFILVLLLRNTQDDLIWFSFIIAALAAYPANLATESQQQLIYDIAGQVYSKAFTITQTVGYNTGQSLYPYNVLVASFISNFITISLYVLIAVFIIWALGNVYKIKRGKP